MLRLTRAQVREVDRRAIEVYRVPGVVLMEHAAMAVTAQARPLAAASGALIVCGGGNNGGDGLAVARMLAIEGAGVELLLAVDPAKYRGDALINWRIIEAMKIPWSPADVDAIERSTRGVIVDALFGTGLTKTPREYEARLIEAMNRSGKPIVAVDLPSGMDCDTGEPLGVCVRASRTVTFVAEKTGFATARAREYTGDVIVGDIGCPREVVEEVLRSKG